MAAPTGLNAVARNAKVTLSWTAVSGATGYKVFRSTISGNYSATPVATLSDTTCTDPGLTNDVTYYYVVKASNTGGDSVNSSQVSATPRLPFVITNVSNGQALSDLFTVNVTVNSPDISEYGDLSLSIINSAGQTVDKLMATPQSSSSGRSSLFVLSTFYYPNGSTTLRVSDGSGYEVSRSVTFDNDVYNFSRDGVFDTTIGVTDVPSSAHISASMKVGFSGWNITISDLDGNVVKIFTGTSSTINVIWDGTDNSGNQVPPQCYQVKLTPGSSSATTSSVRTARRGFSLASWNAAIPARHQSNFRLIQSTTSKPILSWINKNVNSDVMVLLRLDVFPGGMPSLISYAKFITGQLAIRQGVTYYGPIQILVTDARIVNSNAAVRSCINSLLSARKVLVYVDAEGGELPTPYFAVGSYSWYSHNPPAILRPGIVTSYDVSALTANLSYGGGNWDFGSTDPPTLVWMDHYRTFGDDGGIPSWQGGTGGDGPPIGGLVPYNPWRWDWAIPFGIGTVTNTSDGGTLLGVGGTLHKYGAYPPPTDTWDLWRINMWSHLFAGGKNFITSFNQTNSVTPSGAFPFPDNPQDKYNWYGNPYGAF